MLASKALPIKAGLWFTSTVPPCDLSTSKGSQGSSRGVCVKDGNTLLSRQQWQWVFWLATKHQPMGQHNEKSSQFIRICRRGPVLLGTISHWFWKSSNVWQPQQCHLWKLKLKTREENLCRKSLSQDITLSRWTENQR